MFRERGAENMAYNVIWLLATLYLACAVHNATNGTSTTSPTRLNLTTTVLPTTTTPLTKKVYLYMTNRTTVYRFPLNKNTGLFENSSKKPEVLHKSTGFIRALEIDEANEHLYWADYVHDTIKQSTLDGDNVHTIFEYGVGHVEGLAIDWSSNILYWTDSTVKMIELSRVDVASVANRKVLFKLEESSQPRGIFVDPIHGYLFWTDWGNSPKIERSDLSGENRITVVSTAIKWPNDIAVDHTSKRLYWIDAHSDKLESVNLYGRDRKIEARLTYNRIAVHPYSMTFMIGTNISYISDWILDSLYRLDHKSNGNVSFVYQNSRRRKNIGQVRVSGQHQKTVSRICFSKENRCSHLCLTSPNNSTKCACPSGMILSNDGVKCMSAERDFEIYFADSSIQSVNHIIKYKDQEGFTIKPLPKPKGETFEFPVALDVHFKTNNIYWSDFKTRKVYRMKEDGSNFSTVLQSNILSPNVLEIDQLTNVMYLFDHKAESIFMISLDGKTKKTILRNLGEVVDIALHEEKGYLYYIDYTNEVIGRVNTDGSNLITYGSGEFPSYATGLAVDKVEGRVYFCDDTLYKLESTDLKFADYRLHIQKTFYRFNSFWLIRGRGSIVSPHSLAILHDKIYWTDIAKKSIYEADKRFGSPIKYITAGLKSPRDLHVFNDRMNSTTEKKKMYIFSIGKIPGTNRAQCYRDKVQCIQQYTPIPPSCPKGYRQTNTILSCNQCSEPLGGNFACPCTNWHTCAQRTYGNVAGCHPTRPFMKYAARECEQIVKPGYCPYDASECSKIEGICDSDNDCSGEEKCCTSLCTRTCMKPVKENPHPCNINNGGCSHFCLAKEKEYKCTCPDGMGLIDDKQCVPNEQICKLPKDIGFCTPITQTFNQRYYFNPASKKCESFLYSGCGGNANNFMKFSECVNSCSGKCPKNVITVCTFTNISCSSNQQCPSNRLCCEYGCGKKCLIPEPYNACRTGICNNSGMCITHSATDFYCSCPIKMPYLTGKTCSLDLRENLLTAVFKKKNANAKFDFKSFSEDLARSYTLYCIRNYKKCTYVEEEIEKRRRKRRSTPTEPHILTMFTIKDIYVNEYKNKDGEMTIKFAVLKPAIEANARKGFLSSESARSGLLEFGEQLAKNHNVTFRRADKPSTLTKEKKKSKAGVTVAVVLIILLLLVGAGLLIFYFRKKNYFSGILKSKQQNNQMRVSFENQLYNDMNTSSITTPTSQELDKKEAIFAIPEGATAVPPSEVKVPPKDWVKFEEPQEDDIKKSPIDDFVEVTDDVPQHWEKFDDTETKPEKDIAGNYDFAEMAP